MSPTELEAYLKVMQAAGVMSCRMVLHADAEVNVTFAPAIPKESTGAPLPGGWKTAPSDALDPDPLGLGSLDAPLAFDEVEL